MIFNASNVRLYLAFVDSDLLGLGSFPCLNSGKVLLVIGLEFCTSLFIVGFKLLFILTGRCPGGFVFGSDLFFVTSVVAFESCLFSLDPFANGGVFFFRPGIQFGKLSLFDLFSICFFGISLFFGSGIRFLESGVGVTLGLCLCFGLSLCFTFGFGLNSFGFAFFAFGFFCSFFFELKLLIGPVPGFTF